tara:strand:- start:9 stop:1139 length:1131 start_codon:yes stop_codon:yes gene_type:complete
MSITRLQQARQMYAMGQRVGRIAFGGGGSYSSKSSGYQGGSGAPGSAESKGSSKSTSTGGSTGNLGGGGGGQNSEYRKYKAPTKPTYTAETIDFKPVTGADYQKSKNEFINNLNANNLFQSQITNTPFVPYQGGAKTTDYYNSNPLKKLFKMAAGIAIPGAGFLMNYGGKFKDGIMSLNNRIQNSDFGRSKNLMDYLDMKKYGGYDEREMTRRINMDEAKLLQDRIDEGEFDGFERPTQTFSFDNSAMKPSDLNNLESLVAASQAPQGLMKPGGFYPENYGTESFMPVSPPYNPVGVQTIANNENFPLRDDFLVNIQNNQDITTLPAAYEEINKMPINIDDPFSEFKNQQKFQKENLNNPNYYKVINDYTGSKFRL